MPSTQGSLMQMSIVILSSSIAFPSYPHHAVTCVRTHVPERNACVSASLEVLKNNRIPTSAHVYGTFNIAHAVKAIIVHQKLPTKEHPATIIGVERELVATFPADRHPATPAACKVLSPDKSPPSFRTAWMIDIRNNPLGGSRGLVQGRDFLQALHVIHLLSEALLGIIPQVSPRHRSVLPLSILP